MANRFCFRGLFSRLFHKQREQRRGESIPLDSLYRTLSYRFRNEALLRQALTHRSFLTDEKGRWTSNERLEFLGDAVLGLVVTDELFRHFPKSSEGVLTKAKSYVVSRETLAKQAKNIDLGKYILLGEGEERSGGRARKSILSDAYEALLGALFLDGGLEEVRRFIRRHLLMDMDRFISHKFHHNYKSWLLEHVQAEGISSPEYRVLKETGPDHRKEFTVEVLVDGKVLGKGSGYSKKKAEQEAALMAVQQLGLREEKRDELFS